jgi:hypothetical protein
MTASDVVEASVASVVSVASAVVCSVAEVSAWSLVAAPPPQAASVTHMAAAHALAKNEVRNVFFIIFLSVTAHDPSQASYVRGAVRVRNSIHSILFCAS